MTTPLLFDLTYELVTPLFMSGVDGAQPELRGASIRGAVRAWYRALDPAFISQERNTFGAAFDDPEQEQQTQQSPFLLQVLRSPPDTGFQLDRANYAKFNRGKPPDRTNGVLYTGYTLLPDFNRRAGFRPSDGHVRREFTLRLLFPKAPNLDRPEEMRRLHRILGAFWVLGHLGALGSRANRCWGSVQLKGLELGPKSRVDAGWSEFLDRYRPASTTSAHRWAGEVAGVLTDLSRALRRPARTGHALATPHLGDGARICLASRSTRSWETAMDEAGAALQRFRRQNGHEDRAEVVRALLHHAGMLPTEAGALPHAPRRTAFGLPYTMLYALTPKWIKDAGLSRLDTDMIEFNPASGGPASDVAPRHASALRMRVVHLDGGYHPLYVRLAGDPVGSRPRDNNAPSTTPAVSIGGQVYSGKRKVAAIPPMPRPPPTDALLDSFMTTIAASALDLPVPV